MLLRPFVADVLVGQTIVSLLQSGDMISDDARDVKRVMQAEITLRRIQAILIGFANVEYT
jgi:hypothetical protein